MLYLDENRGVEGSEQWTLTYSLCQEHLLSSRPSVLHDMPLLLDCIMNGFVLVTFNVFRDKRFHAAPAVLGITFYWVVF